MAGIERHSELPSQEEIAAALRKIPKRALRTEWITEEAGGRFLLGLECVQALVDPKASDEKAYSNGLRDYLRTAVARMGSDSNRILIEVVFGIGDKQWDNKKWRQKKAKVRRRQAGKEFRPESEPVAADTIRQSYEPKAVEELAAIVYEEEKRARK